ncbi:MAG: DUF4238 domain-containing protein, partial [Dongiaceae bacterium]
KAQHYIAQGYTRAWCDPSRASREEPFVWVFDRDGPTAETSGKRNAPVNLFKEPEMYTITPANDPQGRDLSLEHALSKIESDFCTVRRDFIEPKCPLGERERAVLLAFVTSSQFRTPGYREHMRTQWQPVLDSGRQLEEWMRTATPEQKVHMARGSLGSSVRKGGITIDQVQAIVDKPLQTTLASHVHALVPLLQKMTHMTILCTTRTPGFITSDDPVVWFDPESPKRQPMFQGPALMYETTEITLPISPTRMMFLSRQDLNWPEYLDLDARDLNDRALNDLNHRTCRYAREKVVVSRNEFRPIWAEDGEPPADAWGPPDADQGNAA